jgi:hypothetical protein
MIAVQNDLRSAYKFLRVSKVNLLRSDKFIFSPLRNQRAARFAVVVLFFGGVLPVDRVLHVPLQETIRERMIW